jgi:hypothetical protein
MIRFATSYENVASVPQAGRNVQAIACLITRRRVKRHVKMMNDE